MAKRKPKPIDPLADVLTCRDLAAELDCSLARAKQIGKQGAIGRKVGNQFLFARAEVDEFKKNRPTVGKKPSVDPHQVASLSKQGYTHAEIAERLGSREGTTSSVISRLRTNSEKKNK